MRKLVVLILFLAVNQELFAQLPQLSKANNQTKMLLNGRPFLILGSEMHNSTGSDTAAVTAVMKEANALKMNNILGYAYWEMIEPLEGKFNFDLVDHLILASEKENLKMILACFGTWKSTPSSYVPEWVKTNPQRFERFVTEGGSSLDILSPF